MSKKVYKKDGREYVFNHMHFNACFEERCKKDGGLKGKYEGIMASGLGVGSSTLHNWRIGISSPQNLEYIIRLAEICECDFYDLCTEKNQSMSEITEDNRLTKVEADNEEVNDAELIAQIEENAKLRGYTLEDLEKEMNRPKGFFERICRGELELSRKADEQIEDLLFLRVDGTVIDDLERYVRVVNKRIGPYLQNELERCGVTEGEFIRLLRNDIIAWYLGTHTVVPIKFKVVNGKPNLFTKEYVETAIRRALEGRDKNRKDRERIAKLIKSSEKFLEKTRKRKASVVDE